MALIQKANRNKTKSKINNSKWYLLSNIEDNSLTLTIQFHKLRMLSEIQLSDFGVTLVYSSRSDDTQLPVIIPDLGSCQDYDYKNLPKSNPIEAQSTT